MIAMFDVKVKEIPYQELLKLGERTTEMENYQRRHVDQEKKTSMREFLTFFITKKQEIIQKIEDLRTSKEETKAKDSNTLIMSSLNKSPQ